MELDKIRTAIRLGNFTPADREWHELRTKGITGTDCGAILGVSPFSSPYKIWAIKTGQIKDEVKMNQAMRLGQLFEAPLIQMFRENNPEATVHEDVGTYVHEDFPELIANPDGLVTIGEKLYILEIKTSKRYWESVPPHYIAQVYHYAKVFSADGIKLVSYAGGMYQEWDIQFQDIELDFQAEIIREFWNTHVVEGTPPDYDGSQSTYEAVRTIARPGDPEVTVELGFLGVQLSNAQKEFDEAENKLRELKSATLAQMENAKYGSVNANEETFIVATKKQRGEGRPWLEVTK